MRRTIRASLSSLMVVVIFSLSAYTPAWGQSGSTTASVTGLVTDEQRAIIPGALVTAKNLQTNLTRETQSGEDGSFLISQLPPGSYELTVTADGFTTKTSRLDLVLGTTTLLNFAMKVGSASEIIEVTASNTIDEGKTESSTNNSRDRIDSLPINRRNFLDFSLTSARVVMDRAPAQGASATSGLSFNGQTARGNNITIDGLDNNDTASSSVRSTFSQDAVQEFQVVSDSYSAEFGRALGGVVNIVTRGGGNEYHGNLFFLNRNDTISARDVFAPFKPPYQQYQFGSVLGGPIKKDKLFFFTSFERLSIKQNNFVTISDESVSAANRQGLELRNGPIPFSVGTTSVLGRVDGRISPADTLWVRYNFGGTYNGALEPFGALIGDTNGGVQRLDDNAIAASNSYVSAGLGLVNETRFLYGRRKQSVVQIGNDPQVRIEAPEGQITFGRGTFLPQFRQERIYQIVDNVSLTRGHHQLRFGFDYLHNDFPAGKTTVPVFPGGLALFVPLDFTALAGMPGLPSFTGLQAFDPTLRTPGQRAFLTVLAALLPGIAPGFPTGVPLADLSIPLAYIQGFGGDRPDLPQKTFSAFFQDDIKLSANLVVKAGVRYDINRVRFMPDNSGNFSPRLAVSYRPTRLPKLNLRAAYGIFFSGIQVAGVALAIQNTSGSGSLKLPVIPFPFSVLPFSLPGHHFPDSDELPPGVVLIPQLSQSFAYQKNVRNSYTQQINTGFDYFIGNNTAISVSYDYVRGIKLFSPRNINPVVRPIPGSPVQSAIVGRVDPTRGDLFEFESSFDSYFHALTLLFNRRFTNHFGLLAHYTFSKAIDDFIDVRTDLQEVVDPLKPRNERGLSLQDVRSRFGLSGIWDLNYTKNRFLRDFQISTIIDLTSGRPYNLLAGQDLNLNGDFPPGDRPLVGGVSLGRNVGITTGFASVDLRLMRAITVKERYRFQGFIEAFNLFNRVNINDVDRIFPPDAQGNFNLPPKQGGRFIAPRDRYRSAFSPRQFQFGFRFTF